MDAGRVESQRAGNLAAALAYVAFGAAAVSIRFSMRQSDAMALAFLRYAIAVAVLFPVLWMRRVKVTFAPGDLPKTLMLGGVLYGALPVLTNLALARTTAWRASLIMSATPMLTLCFSSMMSVEKLSRTRLVGVLLSMAGVVLAIVPAILRGGGRSETLTGDLLMVGVTLGLSGYNVLSRPVVRKYPALPVTAYGMAISTALLLPAMALQGPVTRVLSYGAQTWGAIVFLGLVGTALGFLLMTWALGQTGPARVAIFQNGMPFTAGILGALLLGEALSVWWAAGTVLVITGVVVANLNQRGPQPAPVVSSGAR